MTQSLPWVYTRSAESTHTHAHTHTHTRTHTHTHTHTHTYTHTHTRTHTHTHSHLVVKCLYIIQMYAWIHERWFISIIGFAIKTVNIQQHLTLNFQELGGSEQIRMYWDMYYTGRHLIVRHH